MAVLINNDSTAATHFWFLGMVATDPRRVANSFQLAGADTVDGCTFRALLNTGTAKTIVARIETNSGGNPSGSLADANLTGTVTGTSSTSGEPVLHTVTFTAPVALLANTIYWLVIQFNSETGEDQYYNAYDSTADPYANGNLNKFATATWAAQATLDLFFQITGTAAPPSAISGYKSLLGVGQA